MTIEVRILGCGSSGGVPRLGEGGPQWGVCDPAQPRNRRTRCSVLVSRKGANGDTRALVDTSPDLREQLLAAKVGRLDGVLITHDHADQTHGMDDLRVLVLAAKGRKIDLWSDRFALDTFATIKGNDSLPSTRKQGGIYGSVWMLRPTQPCSVTITESMYGERMVRLMSSVRLTAVTLKNANLTSGLKT